MPESPFLVELLVLIAAAAAGVALFERLRLPAIAGFLVAGALLGPAGLGLVGDSERVRALAEFGVVFLLFEIGLELPLDLLRRHGRILLAAGGLQVAATLACVAALAVGLGLRTPSALLLGGLVSMSSTALVIRLLAARGQVDAPHGQLGVGILLFQDLCIVPFLLAVPILAGEATLRPWDVAEALLRGATGLALLIVAAYFLLPRVLAAAVRLRSADLLSLVAFLVVLGFAVASQALGLTLAVGAFVSGLLLGASPYAHQLFAEVAPVRGVLLGLFFTAVGMLFDPAAAWAAWPLVLGYVGAVVVLKTVIVVLVVAVVLRRGIRLALLTGVTLAQTGEFSFVLGEAGRDAGILDPTLHQVFVAGSVLTLVATPWLFVAAPPLASALAGLGERRSGDAGDAAEPPEGFALLFGFGLAGRTMARVLRSFDIPWLAVDVDPASVAEARGRGEPVVYGDITRAAILERLHVERARLVCIALSDPIATRRCVALVHDLAPRVHVVVRTRYVAEVDALSELGADVVVVEEFEAMIDMVRAALRSFGFPAEPIERFAEQLREEGYQVMRTPPALALDPWLTEILSEVATEWVEVPDGPAAGHSIAELAIRKRTGASVLAVERRGATTPNPAPEFVLAAGDRLLAYGSATNLRSMRTLLASGVA